MTSHGMPRVSGIAPTSEKDREKELKKINEYKNLVDSVNSKIHKNIYTPETLDLTSKLLQQNPEYYTIWNDRRLIVRELLSGIEREMVENPIETQNHRLATFIKSDLMFLIPLLRKFPKCYWIWNYRLWLLEQTAVRCVPESSLQIWQEDLALVSKMLGLDSRNFLAWGYRRTVVAELEKIRGAMAEPLIPLTENEFEYTTQMVKANLSNFSAWHRRSKLIPQVLSQRKADDVARRQMLDSELELVQRALWTGDNDQSIWFYHQVLMCNFDPRYAKDTIAPNLSNKERIDYVLDEMEKVLEMLHDADDCKWIYQALVNLSKLHHELAGQWPRRSNEIQKWLQDLEKLDPLRAGRWRDLNTQLSSDNMQLMT